MRMAALKKDEADLGALYEKLCHDRNLHIRELRRIADENCSKFKGFPVMDNRYLLMKMIGRGGFSEVYKAFDLLELKVVACKI